MKKPHLLFTLTIPVFAITTYYCWDYLPAWADFLKRNSDLIQTLGVIFGGLSSIIVWKWRQNLPTDPPDLETETDNRHGVSVDTRYEPTPLDNNLDVDQAVSPYVGLSAFQSGDSHLFFGRRRETREALSVLGRPMDIVDQSGETPLCRWLQIEGNSGAGKSSLVNAALLPAIEAGKLITQAGYTHWIIIKSMMPGETPLKRLAEALEHSFVSNPAQRDTLARQQKLEADERALAYMLNDLKTHQQTAFVLFVDQFEELFTFAGKLEKRQFDAQIAYALQDKDCPLFLISTVRIDFLEGFEQLPKLSRLYNRYCKRYLLETISLEGLEEAIRKPAQLAGLDVSEVTTAILQDAQDETGALPLVENALQVLWQQRQNNKLSGELYRQKGRLVGLLEEQADALLTALDRKISKGKHAALELLLALTRINDEGRHTRRNLGLGEACLIAGGKQADKQRGLQIIDYLTGRQAIDEQHNNNGRLRLLTTIGETEQEQQVSIIHETLIRARGKNKSTGKLVGYWKTLYNYIEKNRDRGFYRDQLARQAEVWQQSTGINRWFALADWRDLKHYRKLRLDKNTRDERFQRWSQRKTWLQAGLLTLLLVFVGESYLWTLNHGFSPDYMLMQQKFRLMQRGWMDEPLPELVKIPASNETFQIGEDDKTFIRRIKGTEYVKNFGIPNSAPVAIKQAFYLGKYEVSYAQYDYYVWSQRDLKNPPAYPSNPPKETQRGNRAVVNVSWNDVNAYLQWLSDKTGDSYRLPTEVEWEYAARAGTTTAYWWGDTVKMGETVMANCDRCGSEWDNQRVAPVQSFTANPFGLHNTAGNVWEWTASEWQKQFDGSENHVISSENQSGRRVIRGGSWDDSSDWLRTSARNRYSTDFRDNTVGFRVFRSARTD